MNHRADIQCLIKECMDIGGAFALTKALQHEFNVLALFGDDGLEQRRHDLTANVFPGYLCVSEAKVAIALLQVHQPVQLIFVPGSSQFGGQCLFEVGVIGEHLQALAGRIEISLVMIDHQRTGQLDTGCLFAQAHGFERWPPHCNAWLTDQTVQGVEFAGSEDLRFALDHQIGSRLIL